MRAGDRRQPRSRSQHGEIALARKGVDVIGAYHSNKAEADGASGGHRKRWGARRRCSSSIPAELPTSRRLQRIWKRALAEGWSRSNFDYLVNNAGIGIHSPFAETTEADFDPWLMNINLKGVFFLTQTLLPMIADGGRIVEPPQAASLGSACRGYAAYGATKGGVEVLMRAISPSEPGTAGHRGEHHRSRRDRDRFWPAAPCATTRRSTKFIASVTALGRPGLPDDIVAPQVAALLQARTNHSDQRPADRSRRRHVRLRGTP